LRYTGGNVADPTYERVCRHRTPRRGGRGVVRPAQVSYAQLLQVFWRIHNRPPATARVRFRQPVRSAIFCHDAGQQSAIASRDAEQPSLRRQIVTQ